MVNQEKVVEKVVDFDLHTLFFLPFIQFIFPFPSQVKEALMEIVQGVSLEFYETFH